MILAVDVQYEEESAVILPYEPGSFYKRELPCILSLLKDIYKQLDAIVIDGYAT